MKRYDCFRAIAPRIGDALAVSNLANTATEWEAARPHPGNLNYVGMGMVTPYAIGLALALPHRPVLAIDGDGGALFDLGVFGVLAQTAPANLCVAVLDNEGYVSTGDSASVASLSAGPVDIAAVARAAGVRDATEVRSVDAFADAVEAGLESDAGPAVVVAKTDASQAFVGADTLDFKENRYRFVRHVERLEGKAILKPSAREHGAPPPPDPDFSPVAADDPFGEVLFDGLRENMVDFVVGLPCSGFAAAQTRCMEDQSIRYVGVANEGTGLGLCAGAWLGGRTPAAVIENFGLFAGAYQLLRGHYSWGIPTLIVAEYRGDAGDTEFFAESGEMTEPLLDAIRINYRVVRELRDIKPAIRDGLRWMRFGLRPYCILPSFDLTRHRPPAGQAGQREGEPCASSISA